MTEQYRIQFGDEHLEYRPAAIADPVPTGRQLLEAAGVSPTTEHIIFRLLGNGMLEELRPDETTDLRTSGVEKFLVFRSDRSFRFELDGRIFEWGTSRILGLVLKKLAGVDPATFKVWQDRPGGDNAIDDAEHANLQPAGVERFHTEKKGITIYINGEPTLWRAERITYDEAVKIAFPDGPFGGDIRYNVSWTKPDGQEGPLRPNHSVDVVEGMRFRVRNTDKS